MASDRFSRGPSSSPREPVRLPLPVPFVVGHVNAYLLEGEPLTLVDPGPRTPATLAALEAALGERGAALEQVELLLLTHHHVDHTGLAADVKARSGCAVAAYELLATLLRDAEAARAIDDAYAEALLELHGAPPAVIATVAEVSNLDPAVAASVEVTQAFVDGDTFVAGGHELTALARPGHSPTDTIFVHPDGWALVADHLPARGSSVVLMHAPPSGTSDPRQRPHALLAYRASLARTEALGLRRAFPGHGEIVDDPRAAIGHQFAAQERKAGRLLEHLGDGARTAWELAELTRGRTVLAGEGHPWSEAFIVLSDVLAHLDLLIANGLVRELDGDVLAYQAT